MEPAEELAALMSAPTEPSLDRALLLVAAARPGSVLSIEESIDTLDRLAAECPESTVASVTTHVFEDLGFVGDQLDYHDPRNSMFDVVLERRIGMPITLAAVLLEIGRRRGLELDGIGMPGHFLVADQSRPGVYLDPFAGGAARSEQECAEWFHRIHGDESSFEPRFLQPVGNRSIVGRVLNNLTASYQAREATGLDWILDLRLRLPAPPPDKRALAALCESRGRFEEAASLLEELAETIGSEAAARRADHLRARLN